MNKILNIILISAISLIINSCANYYYFSNSQNVPALYGKNQFNLGASYNTSFNHSGIDIQSAFSLTDNLTISGNYFYCSHDINQTTVIWNPDDSSKPINYNYKTNNSLGELAFGYYKKLDNFNLFEIYAGYGQGSIHNQLSSGFDSNYMNIYYYKNQLKFNKFFVQPSLSSKIGIFTYSISTRIVLLNNYNISSDINGSIIHPDDLRDYKIVSNAPLMLLIEPAITSKINFENLYFQLQLGYSKNLTIPTYPQGNTMFSLGLGCNIN